MPRCGDLAIFVMTTDRQQTKPIALPLAHARGVKTEKHRLHSCTAGNIALGVCLKGQTARGYFL